ncbi:MAG: RNA 2',3'-cyclic phosphodiesterase [Planctomycetia bacterium]|nr:RNA 2',3'-cyclic phosphodiesterase [Planctomycetia bacterium]
MPPRLRLFVAIDPPRETATVAARIIERLRRAGVEAAWVDPSQMHLTLHFLGNDVYETDLHGICVALDAACRETPPFDIAFGGVGCFPDSKKPRVIWLGIQEGAEALAALYDALAARLEPLGFPPEARGYRPHLTIGRFKHARQLGQGADSGSIAAHLSGVAVEHAGQMTVSRVCLYASRLEKHAAEYDRLHTAPLRPR